MASRFPILNMSQPHKSSRRDFLRGRAAVEALQSVVGDGEFSVAQSEASGYLLRIGRKAMACEFEVLLNAGQYPNGTDAAVAALDVVDQLESQLTVYRDDSEVSRLNRSAHLGPVEVEPRLFALLEKALQIHRDTSGAYDITSGPLTKAWGFYRRDGRMPDQGELSEVMQRVGLKHVEFNVGLKSIRFDTAGVEINLGSIGKGHALDRAADLLIAAGIENFLIHGGNSSVLGRGSTGTSPTDDSVTESSSNGGWWVGLRHPLQPQRRIGEIRLSDRALGTSGSGTQFFVHEGKRFGHILDPRTGWPAEGTLSTTVAVPTGAEADALATAFYVLGCDAAIEYCRKHAGISAVIMSPASKDGHVDVTLWGFAKSDLRLEPDDSLSIRRIES